MYIPYQGGLTSGRTLRILPNTGEKAPQKVVFADDEGVVQVSLNNGTFQASSHTFGPKEIIVLGD